jgi:hypothetical protein
LKLVILLCVSLNLAAYRFLGEILMERRVVVWDLGIRLLFSIDDLSKEPISCKIQGDTEEDN